MKRSHFAVLSALGALVSILLLGSVWMRFGRHDVAPPPALSGQRITRAYDFADFTRVGAQGVWQVTLARGDAWTAELSYPAELEQYLKVGVEDHQLMLRYSLERGWWRNVGRRGEQGMAARVTMPALDHVDLSGTASLVFSGFEGAELDISTTGATKIDGTDSRYERVDLDMSGAGEADLRGVATTSVKIDLSGASKVVLRMAGGRLEGDVSGATSLEYFGTVSSLDVDTSGIASVKKLD
jgi:hypothetical protein